MCLVNTRLDTRSAFELLGHAAYPVSKILIDCGDYTTIIRIRGAKKSLRQPAINRILPVANAFDRTVESMLPLARMQRERDSLKAAYLAAQPYPHVVMDGFVEEEVLDRTVTNFPEPEARDWITYETKHESKQTSRGITQLSPFTQLVFLQLCS